MWWQSYLVSLVFDTALQPRLTQLLVALYTIDVFDESLVIIMRISTSCESDFGDLSLEIRKLALSPNTLFQLYLPNKQDDIIDSEQKLSQVWTDWSKFGEGMRVILKYSNRAFCCFSILLST